MSPIEGDRKGDCIKKISVLGTGWLGFALSKYFISCGFDVKGSTRSAERSSLLSENGIWPFIVDISKGEFGLDNFLDADILVVNIPFKGASEFSTLIKKIERSSITHIIFVSSTSVYRHKTGLISEADDDHLEPNVLLDIETLFTSNKHFCTTVLRFSGLIGPSRNPALFFKNNRLVNSPASQVNMIHREDCINIIYLIIKKKVWGRTYNCCSDSHPTKKQFYTHVATISCLPIPIFSENNDDSYKIISNKKLKNELGYHFLYSNLLDLCMSDIG